MHYETVRICDADNWRECHEVFNSIVDLCVLGKCRKRHRCALRMAHVKHFAIARRALDVLQHRGQVDLRVLVERKLPVRAVSVRVECLVHAAVVVAADVSHPYVEAGVRQHVAEALAGHIVNPTNKNATNSHPLEYE